MFILTFKKACFKNTNLNLILIQKWPDLIEKLNYAEKVAQLEKVNRNYNYLNEIERLNDLTPSLPVMSLTKPQNSFSLSLSLASDSPIPNTGCQCSYCISMKSYNAYNSISGYDSAYQLCLEREKLLKEREGKLLADQKLLLSMQANPLFEYDENLNAIKDYIKIEQLKIEYESRRKSQELLNNSPAMEPKLNVIQASRKRSCYQNSIDSLTYELYANQARRENPWKLH